MREPDWKRRRTDDVNTSSAVADPVGPLGMSKCPAGRSARGSLDRVEKDPMNALFRRAFVLAALPAQPWSVTSGRFDGNQ
jgi:hypothetical protein